LAARGSTSLLQMSVSFLSMSFPSKSFFTFSHVDPPWRLFSSGRLPKSMALAWMMARPVACTEPSRLRHWHVGICDTRFRHCRCGLPHMRRRIHLPRSGSKPQLSGRTQGLPVPHRQLPPRLAMIPKPSTTTASISFGLAVLHRICRQWSS